MVDTALGRFAFASCSRLRTLWSLKGPRTWQMSQLGQLTPHLVFVWHLVHIYGSVRRMTQFVGSQSLSGLELKEKEMLLLRHDFAWGLFELQKNGSA
jgi:hypothetical protein